MYGFINAKNGYGRSTTSRETNKVLDAIGGKKCVLCVTYGYNKRIVKRLCHVIVDGQVKRPGDVAEDLHNSPVPSSIMPGVIPALNIPKLQVGMTFAEHKYQDYFS